MYKMVVSSFCNTLIGRDEAIAISTMLEIDRVRNKDVLFVIATGRHYRTIFDYNRSYIFCDYIIAFDGSYIFDLNKDKVIFKKNISSSIVKKVYSKFKDYDMAFYTINDTYYFGKNYDYEYPVLLNDFKNFISFHEEDIYKIEIHGDVDDIINKIQGVDYFIRDGYVDLVSKGVSKFQGLVKILQLLDIKLEEVVGIGRDFSDDYLGKIGKSIAVDKDDSKVIDRCSCASDIESLLKECFK